MMKIVLHSSLISKFNFLCYTLATIRFDGFPSSMFQEVGKKLGFCPNQRAGMTKANCNINNSFVFWVKSFVFRKKVGIFLGGRSGRLGQNHNFFQTGGLLRELL